MLFVIEERDGVDEGIPNPRGHTLVVVNIVFVILSTLLVAARWFTRVKIQRLIGPDDWFILSVVVSVRDLSNAF